MGPVYGAKEADALAKAFDWTVKADGECHMQPLSHIILLFSGEYFRRVVPSPQPVEIVQLDVRADTKRCCLLLRFYYAGD